MGRLTRLGIYWWEHFKAAKEHGDMIASFLVGVLSLGVLYMKAIGQPLPDVLENDWATYFGITAVIAAGFHLFIYRPFARHEELQAELDRLKASPADFAVEFEDLVILPPDADSGNNSECRFVVRNKSERTIGNIELEIADLFEKGDPKRNAGLGFPIPLSTFSDEDSAINPGDGLTFKFVWQARVVTVGGNRFVYGNIANDGSQVAFKVGEEYPITLLIRGTDTKQHTFALKFAFVGDYPAPAFK